MKMVRTKKAQRTPVLSEDSCQGSYLSREDPELSGKKKKEQDKNPWQDYERLSNTEEHQLSVSAFNVEPQLGLNRSRFQKCLILF